MCKLYQAALLAAGATCLQVPASAQVLIQPSVDSREQRSSLRNLSSCLAQARPEWARQTLAQPYLSAAQARLAGHALSGRDKCIKGAEVEVTFRTSGLVGSMAEHFVRPQIATADLPRVAQKLSTLAPLNSSEDFAFCVTASSPDAARDLLLSEPGSDAEGRAVGQLATYVPACVGRGERLVVDQQALRALISVAFYRESTAAPLSEIPR
jgi:hypothetical protein